MNPPNETMTMKMTIMQHLCCLLFLPSAVISFTHPHTTTAALGGADTATSLHGVRSSLRRVRDSVLSRERTDKDLKDGIAFFYDRSSKVWEDVWGKFSILSTAVLEIYFSFFTFLSLENRRAHASRLLHTGGQDGSSTGTN